MIIVKKNKDKGRPVSHNNNQQSPNFTFKQKRR